MRRFAVILVVHGDNVLLQRRDDKPGVDYPGELACFGGAVEDQDADYRAAAVRELREETSINFVPEDLAEIGVFRNEVNDEYNKEMREYGIFVIEIESENFDVFEGQGSESYSLDEAIHMAEIGKLRFSAASAIRGYAERKRHAEHN